MEGRGGSLECTGGHGGATAERLDARANRCGVWVGREWLGGNSTRNTTKADQECPAVPQPQRNAMHPCEPASAQSLPRVTRCTYLLLRKSHPAVPPTRATTRLRQSARPGRARRPQRLIGACSPPPPRPTPQEAAPPRCGRATPSAAARRCRRLQRPPRSTHAVRDLGRACAARAAAPAPPPFPPSPAPPRPKLRRQRRLRSEGSRSQSTRV